MRLAFAGLVPIIDLRLQVFALFQQSLIGVAVRVQHMGAGLPKVIRRYICSDNGFVLYEISQLLVDLKAGKFNTCSHFALHEKSRDRLAR